MREYSLPMTLGIFELIVISLIIIPTAFLMVRRHSNARWFLAATISLVAASVFTPADLMSTLLLALCFFGMFSLGARNPVKLTQ